MIKVCESILDYQKRHSSPSIMIPPQYFEQIAEHGHGIFDECGVWKSVFVNGNGTIMVPCWKFNGKENTYSLLDHSIEEIWSLPQWEIAKTCHDCQGSWLHMVFLTTNYYVCPELYERFI